MHYFVDVLLPLSLPKAFTYVVEKSEFDFLSPGYRVGVPFGKNKLYTGLVYQKHQVAPQTYEPKPIEVILDEYPIVTADQITFWEWMSDYYRCSMGSILRTALPSAFLLASETIVAKVSAIEIDWDSVSDDAFLVLEGLGKRDLLIEDIQAIVQRKSVLPLIQDLVEKGYVETVQSLKEKYTPKYHRYLRIAPKYQEDQALATIFEQLKRAPKQSSLLLGLIQEQEEWVKWTPFKKRLGVESTLVKTLLEKEIIEERFVQEDRPILREAKSIERPSLSLAQEKALTQLKQSWEEKDVVLLEGVTSSG